MSNNTDTGKVLLPNNIDVLKFDLKNNDTFSKVCTVRQ